MEKPQFHLWLFDQELTALLEALDVVDAMEFSNDRELNRILGVPFKWTRFIASLIIRYARDMARSAYFEDILTDTINGIMKDATEGGLAQAVAHAKANSQNEEELLNNMKGVVTEAVRLRASDFRRRYHKQQHRMIQFGQAEDDSPEMTSVKQATARGVRPEDQAEEESLEHMVLSQIDQMIAQARESHQTRLVKRLELARLVASDRMAGMVMQDLMTKYELKQTQMQSILQDIESAVQQMGGGMLADKAQGYKRKKTGTGS